MSALDPSALHRLYSDHNSWLKGWLRVRLGNTADACDLAQDTFTMPGRSLVVLAVWAVVALTGAALALRKRT